MLTTSLRYLLCSLFSFKCLLIDIILDLYNVLTFFNPLPQFLWGKYNLPMSELLLKLPVMFRIFLVTISRFSISRIVQSKIPNVGVSTGRVKVLRARCLLYALSSLLYIFCTLFLYLVVTLSLLKLPTYPRFLSCPSLIRLIQTLLISRFCADCLVKTSIFRYAHLLFPNFILILSEQHR